MQEYFKRVVEQKGILKNKLGIAVSGGIDSVVLCELCFQSGFPFVIVHCNFKLRGEESERDEQFVRSLGLKYAAPVWVKAFDTSRYAEEHKLSIQEAARELRYSWFRELTFGEDNPVDCILLGHHANDNIETLLMNFFRGTGIEGVTGMPDYVPASRCFRPLLHKTRQEIENFALQNKVEWVMDSSNLSTKYTRNYFRNELLPSLRKVYPQVEENLENNIKRFQQINNLYRLSVAQLKKEICKGEMPEVRIPAKKLLQYQHTSLIYEIIKDYGFGEKQVPEVIKLAGSESGKYIANESHQIIKHRNWLIIAPVFLPSTTIAVDKHNKEVRLPGKLFQWKIKDSSRSSLDKSDHIAQLDADKVSFPLIVRKWKQGDYFYPLGLGKKKKLARFFIDLKLPLNKKEEVWVVESEQRIIWVAGLRIDDRVKLTPSTKKVLELTITDL